MSGLDSFEKAVAEKKQKRYKKSLSYLKSAIQDFRHKLAEKPHCKESRQGLVSCWELFSSDVKDIMDEPFEEVFKFKKKSNSVLPSLKIAIIDQFFENQWEKQARGKFGGSKPVSLSWKQFYIKLEDDIANLNSDSDKIIWSVEHGHINYLQHILSKKSSQKLNLTTLMVTKSTNILNYAISCNNDKMVLLLLENKVDLNKLDECRRTSLHYAVLNGNKDICEMLLTFGAKVNTKDKWSITPLIIAAKKNHHSILSLLLENKADVNKIDIQGHSAFTYALFNNDLISAEILIKHGADIHIVDHFGRNLLHWASCSNRERIIELLIDNKLDINKQDDLGRAPIHYAAQFGKLNCLRSLIDHQADINIKDYYDETPLIVAAFFGQKEATTYLYEKTEHQL